MGINSPINRKMQNFEVEDMSMESEEDMIAMANQAMAAERTKKAKLEKINKISSYDKEEIEKLLGIKRYTKDVEIDSMSFTLELLSAKDLKLLQEVLKSKEGDPLYVKAKVISKYVIKINGKFLNEVFNSEEQVVDFFLDLNNDLLTAIEQEYNVFTQENLKKLSGNKEIVENLKKS